MPEDERTVRIFILIVFFSDFLDSPASFIRAHTEIFSTIVYPSNRRGAFPGSILAWVRSNFFCIFFLRSFSGRQENFRAAVFCSMNFLPLFRF
jgi:hypothetical protein